LAQESEGGMIEPCTQRTPRASRQLCIVRILAGPAAAIAQRGAELGASGTCRAMMKNAPRRGASCMP